MPWRPCMERQRFRLSKKVQKMLHGGGVLLLARESRNKRSEVDRRNVSRFKKPARGGVKAECAHQINASCACSEIIPHPS